MKCIKWIVALALVAPASLAVADDKTPPPKADQGQMKDKGQKLTMDQLPDAVKTSVEKESKGKQVDSIMKDTKDGKDVFKVDLVANNKVQTLTIDQTGKVIDRGSMRDQNMPKKQSSDTDMP